MNVDRFALFFHSPMIGEGKLLMAGRYRFMNVCERGLGGFLRSKGFILSLLRNLELDKHADIGRKLHEGIWLGARPWSVM
jgi:hypothetical protein